MAQDSSQASSPETASPDVVPTALSNGRQSDTAKEATAPDGTPQDEQADAGTATSPTSTTHTPPRLDTSAALSTPQPTSKEGPAPPMSGNSPLQLAQMIIKDKETGKEYMIADLAGDTDHLSSQRLINLSTNETIVLQYDTLDPEQGSTTARSGSNARSAASSQRLTLASDILGTAGGRGTPREQPGDDRYSTDAVGAAQGSPRVAAKPKSKGVKAWGRKARMWYVARPLLSTAFTDRRSICSTYLR